MIPHSLGRRALAALAAATVLLVPLTVAAPGAHAADSSAPVLTAISATPRTVGPDQVVTVGYQSTEDSGSLSQVVVSFRHWPLTYTAQSAPGSIPTSGSVSLVLPQGAANGLYTLDSVTLTDPSRNTSTTNRDGTVTYSAGAPGPATHSLSLWNGDVTLAGSTPDTTAPSLTALSLANPTLTVGDSAVLHYATEDVSQLTSVVVSYRNSKAGFSIQLTGDGAQVPKTGDVTGLVAASFANGTYDVTSVRVTDQFANSADYWPDGRVTGRTPITSHSLDLAALSFTVSGSTADFDPPILTSLGRPTSPVLSGGPVSMAYAATDAAGSLGSISAQFTDSAGNPLTLTRTGAPLSGTLTGTATPPQNLSGSTSPPPNVVPDHYTLSWVQLADPAGHRATYYPDGRLDLSPGGTSSHSLDLTNHVVLVAALPGPPSGLSVVPGPGSATITWDVGGDAGTPITGYTITASPSGQVVMAAGTAQRATVTGLANGTAYTLTVHAHNALGAGPGASMRGLRRPFGVRILSPGDFDLDGRNDILAVDGSGRMVFYRGNGRGGFAGAGRVVSGGWQTNRLVLPSQGPDQIGMLPDLWAVRFDGTLTAYPSDQQRAGLRAADPRGYGWDKFDTVFASGDFNGDGFPDIMGITDSGDLYFCSNRFRTASFYPGVRIGAGWNGFAQVLAMGDQTGDGHPDLVAIKKDGTLWPYAGNGRGGFAGAGRRIGVGWGGVRAAFSADFDGGGPDLLAVDSRGDLRLYRGNNHGGLSYRGVIGSGWQRYL